MLLLPLLPPVVFMVDEEDDGCSVELVSVVELAEDIVPMPTQYAYPPQKFIVQSFDTSGFQTKKSSSVIPYMFETDQQDSPASTV